MTSRPPTSPQSTSQLNMIILPTGEVLQSSISNYVDIYAPSSATMRGFDESWRPVVTAAPLEVGRGGTYKIEGILFNGMTQGAMFGDDYQGACNYPLLRLTDVKSMHVYYCRTHDHSSMAVASHDPVFTYFDVPIDQPLGNFTLEVVANGIPSVPRNITVLEFPLPTVESTGSPSAAPVVTQSYALCGMGDWQSVVTVECPGASVVTSVDFADFGLPMGNCGNFSIDSSCSASSSKYVVSSACIGENACSILASTDVFGEPCPFVYNKRLFFQLTCTDIPSSMPTTIPSQTPSTTNPTYYITSAPSTPTFAVTANPTLDYVECATASEGSSAALSCPANYSIAQINFASYGNPSGTCGDYQLGQCNSAHSSSVVSGFCLGQQTCSVFASNGNFLGDPCRGTGKQLFFQVTCFPTAPSSLPTATPSTAPISSLPTALL